MVDRTQSGPPALEPLGVGELLDAGFRLWRGNFVALLAIVAIVQAPVAIVSLLVQVSQIVAVDELGTIFVEDPDTYNNLTTIVSLAGIVAALWVLGAVLHLTTHEYVGEPVTIGDALRTGFSRILPYAALAVAFVIAVGAGFLLLIIPGIFLGISLGPSLPAFWAEGVGPFAALGRSWKLVQGRRWAVFGVAFTTVVISFVFYAILAFTLVAVLFSGTSTTGAVLALTLLPLLIELLILPLHPVMMTAVYYDLRVRREAFDVDLAARWLSSDDDPEPPPLFR